MTLGPPEVEMAKRPPSWKDAGPGPWGQIPFSDATSGGRESLATMVARVECEGRQRLPTPDITSRLRFDRGIGTTYDTSGQTMVRQLGVRHSMQITINALATLDDIYEWIVPFEEKMPLFFALEVYSPKFRLVALKRWRQFVQNAKALKANELWIDIVPIPGMRGKVDLKYKNRERFSINLPNLTKGGLREASFGTVATKQKQLKVWRAIIRAIRKHTTGGMWTWNDMHNTKAFSKHHRYSARVAAQHAQGLNLLPFAGGVELFIAEPVISTSSVGEPVVARERGGHTGFARHGLRR